MGNYISLYFVSSSSFFSEKTSDFFFSKGKIEYRNIVSFVLIYPRVIYILRDLIVNKSKSNGGKISIVEDLGNYISLYFVSSSSFFSEKTSDFFFSKGKIEYRNIVSFVLIYPRVIYILRDLIVNKSKSNGGKISIVEDLGNYISFVSSSSFSSEETSDFFFLQRENRIS